ncbi:histidine kinase [uncultured Marivirga sp.]|uniref:sensor histidine kinase n=1 Tax=uncultured Marivirga sp. TaxID=1123707 RepID=UPI0030EBEE83|tara:strand:- start:261325 stop:262365 length:1041 start_codon:yes stop_codon:yes gene_type:complete
MFLQLIRHQSNAWIKLSAILLVWLSLAIFLLMHYDLDLTSAIIDSVLYSSLLILGFMLLDNIFKFYTPTKGNIILVVVFPFILSLILLYTGDLLMKWAVPENLKNVNFQQNAFVIRGFIILLIFTGYSLILNFQAKLEEQVKVEEREVKMQKMANEAELHQLRQQLQPHFLFNSLNSISSLVKVKPEKAREMVLQLSDFLRGTIQKEADRWIQVEDEIQFLNLFIDIEKVRFGHRLQVNFDIEAGIEQLKLPQLMVQPLLENAIKHSLYGLTGDVAITVQFKKMKKSLEIIIENPFDPKAGQTKGAGFGLEAVRRRLFLIFGRYDLLKTTALSQQFKVELLIPQIS